MVATPKSKDNEFDQYRQDQNNHFWVDLIGEENGEVTKFLQKLKRIFIALNNSKHGNYLQQTEIFFGLNYFCGCIGAGTPYQGGWEGEEEKLLIILNYHKT